jgi:SAM-dependent methyltransferase
MTAVLAPRMLNLGCGHRFHPAWENADIAPQSPAVRRVDVATGIPFPDRHFDVVYHSHMIEHIRVGDVQRFLRECWRVLTPGGIIRIATPDLERLCAVYLQKLQASAAADHEWTVIEMLDQMVREQSGGAMLGYLRQNPLPNEGFVLERIGEEGRGLLASIRAARPAQPANGSRGLAARLRDDLRRRKTRVKEALITRWYGRDALQALAIGRFRLSGEVHQWLYDRASLAATLVASGFCDPAVRGAAESAIANWAGYALDTTPAGVVVKPDSMFMEARKPR